MSLGPLLLYRDARTRGVVNIAHLMDSVWDLLIWWWGLPINLGSRYASRVIRVVAILVCPVWCPIAVVLSLPIAVVEFTLWLARSAWREMDEQYGHRRTQKLIQNVRHL